MNIILFGYRGCGKTTLGRKLAGQLWKTFVDTDELALKHLGGKSIAAIWEAHGEAAWRAAEVEVTQQVLGGDEQVIALGGGTLMQEPARQAVRDAMNAVRVYLYCEASELRRRIATDETTRAARPSLTGGANAEDEIDAVLKERDPVYREVADKVLDVTRLSVEDAARYVIQRCL